MLTCLCVVHWNEGDLPEGRARLYKAVIHWLIAARTDQRKQAGFTDRFTLEALALLAFAMMGGETGIKSRSSILKRAPKRFCLSMARYYPTENGIRRAREWLRFECLWSGVVEEASAGKIRFWHLTFQEYLAAQELAWRGDGEGAEDWWPAIRERLDDPQWRETVDLLPGALFDEGGGRRVDLLLRRVIGLRGEQPALVDDARIFGIIGRILGPMTAYGYKPPPDMDTVYHDLRNRTLPIFDRDGAAKVPVKTRIEAADALGRGGDPRLERDTFIEIPGTEGVSLGKYPVTVRDYQAFVDAGGYGEPRHWDQAGWSVRNEKGWEEPDEWDTQARTSEQAGDGRLLVRGRAPIAGGGARKATGPCACPRRPNGGRRRRRTDGSTLGDRRNRMPSVPTARAKWDTPRRSVSIRRGDGVYGHCDLAGNVWEWMKDVWRDDPEEAEKETQEKITSGDRVLRGGSWAIRGTSARPTAQDRTRRPELRVGFRVARTL